MKCSGFFHISPSEVKEKNEKKFGKSEKEDIY
jgi:hypothetical protein